MESKSESHTIDEFSPDYIPEEEESKESAVDLIKRNVRKYCSTKYVKRRIPICEWLPIYNSDDLLGDCIAGLTVGLTVLPQALAYAFLAGLPPNYGLYASYLGCFFYVIFGSCKSLNVGPTAIISILTFEYAHGDPEAAILLCFSTGVLTIIFGMLNLGFLCSFVSKPVLSGFVSAAAITIASSQLKGLFGLKIKPHGLLDTWKEVALHIGETNWPDLAMGVTSIVVLILLKQLNELPRFKRKINDDFPTRAKKMTVFLVSVGRNAIVVITASILAFFLRDNQPFTITGEIKQGLPAISVPQFVSSYTGNGTSGTDFMSMVHGAGAGIIVLPLIVILENVAIANAFSKGKMIDATQEIYAIGICNVLGAFFQTMPTAGSISRSAVNSQSGVRTTAGGIVTGLLVIFALAFLTPYFKFIPLASLAAVIICAVIYMIEYHDIVPIWKVRKVDELVLWVSFVVCIFWSVEFGLLFGVLINLLLLLFSAATPKILVISIPEEYNIPPYVIVEARLGLLFVNVDNLRTKTTKAALREAKGVHPVIIDCYHFSVIDYSASCGMKSMCDDFKNRGQPIFFMNTSPGVKRGLRAINPNVPIVERENLLSTFLELTGGKDKKINIS